MNKKGFAISIILYSMVFLLISIFYMLLGIVRTRYSVTSKLRESIVDKLNNGNNLEEIVSKLCIDESVSYIQKYEPDKNGMAIDTPDGSGDKDVCYYTGADAKENGNLIFGDYCWQIVRSTTDGGIKLIYNGPKTDDNKCPNDNSKRPSTASIVGSVGVEKTDVSGSKIYGTSFEIIEDGNTNKFKLKNTSTYSWSDSTYQNIVGKFVCGTSSSITGTSTMCDILYFIGHYQSSNEASVTKYSISSNSHFSQIGTSAFNTDISSLSLVGYMYNDVYNIQTIDFFTEQNIIYYNDVRTLGNLYYGTKAIWNTSTNMYDLKKDDGTGNYITPTTTDEWLNIRSNVKGMYTCLSSSSTSCPTVYYIVANSTVFNIYAIPLSNGEDASTKTITWTYGTNYEEQNGVYHLTGVNTLTFLLKDWYTDYNDNKFKGIYVCNDFTSSVCSNEVYYIVSTSNYAVSFDKSSNSFYYANSVSYANGNYTIDYNSDSSKYHKLWHRIDRDATNSHYTCFKSNSDNCGDTVYYVYYSNNDSVYRDGGIYYIELKNGETIDDALQKMLNINNLNSDNINKYNSAIKAVIESWYEKNLLSLSNFIDDNAVFCNDRTVIDYLGWKPNGITNNQKMNFNTTTRNYYTASLGCSNMTDRFSKNNINAELKYPIGLLTGIERLFMNQEYAKADNGLWWTLSPHSLIKDIVQNYAVQSSGYSLNEYVYKNNGIRPVIVLKPGIEISDGKGTYDDPYIVDTSIGELIKVDPIENLPEFCRSVTYNGEEQILTIDPPENVTFIDNTGTNAGDYLVKAHIDDGFAWADGTTDDIEFTCNIRKKAIGSCPSGPMKEWTGDSISSGITCPEGATRGGKNSATGTGVYTSTCTGTGNYSGSCSVTWYICDFTKDGKCYRYWGLSNTFYASSNWDCMQKPNTVINTGHCSAPFGSGSLAKGYTTNGSDANGTKYSCKCYKPY